MGYYRGPRYPRADRDRDRYGERNFGRSGAARFDEEANSNFGPGDRNRSDDYGTSYARDYREGSPRGGRYRDEYDDDRGFFDRAGDEVRSWFGDEEAERRRERDAWYDRRYGDPRDQSSRLGFYDPTATTGYQPYRANHSSGTVPEVRTESGWHEGRAYDPDYHAWRHNRMQELDRDYHEYRTENRERFNREFEGWRNRRQGQRSSLSQVHDHMEVVGSDGAHVGKVDQVAGDRIILAKNDPDSGGQHHWIPSRWINSVEGEQVKLEKTAAQAQEEWRNAERAGQFGGLFDDQGEERGGAHYLHHSFAGTYK